MGADFTISHRRRDTFDLEFTLSDSGGGVETPRDLTGWTARMQIRPSPVVVGQAPLATLTTENGGITLTAQGGVRLFLAPASFVGLAAGSYVYDLIMISPTGVAETLLFGAFVLVESVTE